MGSVLTVWSHTRRPRLIVSDRMDEPSAVLAIFAEHRGDAAVTGSHDHADTAESTVQFRGNGHTWHCQARVPHRCCRFTVNVRQPGNVECKRRQVELLWPRRRPRKRPRNHLLDELVPQRQRVRLHIIELLWRSANANAHGVRHGYVHWLAVEVRQQRGRHHAVTAELRRLVLALASSEQVREQFADRTAHETSDDAPDVRIPWRWDVMESALAHAD